MRTRRVLLQASAAAAALWLGGCGGGDDVTGPPTPPPTPSASIAATGAGTIVIHPSMDSRFGYSLETPIRVTESGGGTATWNFVRYQIYLAGREVERYELGATDIASAGFQTIGARSDRTYTVVYRQNSDDFERIDITLGFSDQKDGRQFTVPVAFNSFTDVAVSLTPLSVPPRGTIRLGAGEK
jgi:hypothetical protein